jgi:hypothetical protein
MRAGRNTYTRDSQRQTALWPCLWREHVAEGFDPDGTMNGHIVDSESSENKGTLEQTLKGLRTC